MENQNPPVPEQILTPAPRAAHPVTEERRRIFLRSLREHGSMEHAARCATSHATGADGGMSSFRREMKRNPAFALEVAQARESAFGAVAKTLHGLATGRYSKTVYHMGRKIGRERIFSIQAALAYLASHDPERWAPRSKQDVTLARGPDAEGALTISPEDALMALAPEEQAQLAELVMKVGAAKAARMGGP